MDHLMVRPPSPPPPVVTRIVALGRWSGSPCDGCAKEAHELIFARTRGHRGRKRIVEVAP
jgi:hypothetical protein